VLSNVWAKTGEDVIAAPGGSGAFRNIVQILLETHGPEPIEEEERGVGSDEAITDREDDNIPAVERARPAAMADGPATRDGGAEVESKSQVPSPPVQPEALVAAVAAVLPQIPKEQRQPLATVFRALADALEEPN
jgi:hypothetical protein